MDIQLLDRYFQLMTKVY